MFPHPCGDQLEAAATAGTDPNSVVADDYFVVKGGTLPIPPTGMVFSGAAGPTLEGAACAVPHGKIQYAIVGDIRQGGGVVRWKPERSRYHTLNKQHVNIIEGGPTVFSNVVWNPVSLKSRIDGQRP